MKSPGWSWGGLVKIQTQKQQQRHPGTKSILPLWAFSSCSRKTEANCLINGMVSAGKPKTGEKKRVTWVLLFSVSGAVCHFSVSSSILAPRRYTSWLEKWATELGPLDPWTPMPDNGQGGRLLPWTLEPFWLPSITKFEGSHTSVPPTHTHIPGPLPS